jgi:exodeoxyribonuclease VII small subunit
VAKEDFEKLSKELAGIVEELEKGEVGLNDALDSFKKGTKLAEKLDGILKGTQKQVELLSKELDGKLKREEFGGEKEVE